MRCVETLHRQALDELARRNQGCDILRTPPYHPELHPIEQVWGMVKSKLADSQDGHYTMASLQKRLEPTFGQGKRIKIFRQTTLYRGSHHPRRPSGASS